MKGKKALVFNVSLLFGFAILLVSGCAGTPHTHIESWTHVMEEDNYRQEEGFMMYRYEDVRFNTADWFDVWMDDSHWDPAAGWSRFVDLFDSEKGLFMYGLVFYDGYIEFPAYGTELIGATLRFYRIPAE